VRHLFSGGYSNFFRYFVFPLYEKFSPRRNVLQYLKEYERNLDLSLEQIKEKQTAACRNLLLHAFETVPYYQSEWRLNGFDPTNFVEITDLEQLPILTKSIIAERYRDFSSSLYRASNIKKATGGSTGRPFRFELDYQSQERRQAVMWRGYGWLGAKLGVSSIIAGAFKPKTKNRILHSQS